MSTLNPLDIRRALGRNSWFVPDPFGGDGWVFVPPAEHVNIHSHALHLWGRLDGKPVLPEFAEFGSI